MGRDSPFENRAETQAEHSFKEIVDQIAHDMASPLSFIDQYIHDLSSPRKDVEIEDIDISEIASRSFKKVRNMLDELRGAIRSTETDMQYHDYADVIQGIIAELRPKAQKSSIDITYFGPDHLEGEFDRNMMERTLANLIMNAIQAIDEDTGSIEVSLEYHGIDAIIAISDDGKGIDANRIEGIFERGATFGKEGGTGLGLAYCKMVIDEHAGLIDVTSTPGKGTSFFLRIPLSPNAIRSMETMQPPSYRDIHAPGEITLDPIY